MDQQNGAGIPGPQKAHTSSPVHKKPNFNLPFTVHMDTSETGLEAHMFDREEHQVILEGKLTPAEQKYAAI